MIYDWQNDRELGYADLQDANGEFYYLPYHRVNTETGECFYYLKWHQNSKGEWSQRINGNGDYVLLENGVEIARGQEWEKRDCEFTLKEAKHIHPAPLKIIWGDPNFEEFLKEREKNKSCIVIVDDPNPPATDEESVTEEELRKAKEWLDRIPQPDTPWEDVVPERLPD